MERLNWHIADELSRYAEVRVIGPSDATAAKPNEVTFSGAPLRPLWLFLLAAQCKAFWHAITWRPDIILAGSGLTAPLAVTASWLCGAKSAIYLHGLDITVKNGAYQLFWLPLIRRAHVFIVNSTPTKALAVAAGIDGTRTHTIPPGVHIPEEPCDLQKKFFLKEHGLDGAKILLSVGRLTARKGLREFIQHALPLIVAQEPGATLVVIGSAPSNALSAEVQTPESLLETATAVGVADNLKLLGSVSEDSLNTAFACSALHVFPIRHIPNDPEGFGMVAIEAAAHGVPTIAFATGGVIDAVEHEKSGVLLKPESYPEMAEAIVEVLSGSKRIDPTEAKSFSKGFVWPSFGQKIYHALNSINQPS